MIHNFEEFVNESKKKKDADTDKQEKKEEKSTISAADEEKYLSPKQRKLPEGLKKGIIARMKKNA